MPKKRTYFWRCKCHSSQYHEAEHGDLHVEKLSTEQKKRGSIRRQETARLWRNLEEKKKQTELSKLQTQMLSSFTISLLTMFAHSCVDNSCEEIWTNIYSTRKSTNGSLKHVQTGKPVSFLDLHIKDGQAVTYKNEDNP